MRTGLDYLEHKKLEDYSSKEIVPRKIIRTPLKGVLKVATKGKLIVDIKPNEVLEKNKPYIFVSTHYHSEDIITNLRALDRPTYVLIGTTYQLEHNFQMYGAWANGIVYVDRRSKESRKESLKIMEWLLKEGVSVLIYLEGGWNNTENLLVNQLFSGAYKLSSRTQVEVAPISNYLETDSNSIYISFGKPIKAYQYEKEEANQEIRNAMATLMFNQIKNYSVPINRAALSDNYHEQFLEGRVQEYYKYNTKWPTDPDEFIEVMQEELTVYKPKNIITPEDIITPENEHLFPWLSYRKEEDFKNYILTRKKAG